MPSANRWKQIRWYLPFWLLATICLWTFTFDSHPGWDTAVYGKAMSYLAKGQNPYTEGVAIQKVYHENYKPGTRFAPPFTYVYSPETLPILKMLMPLPGSVLAAGYALLFFIGMGLQFWAFSQMAESSERLWLHVFLPLSIIFPGLLNADTILSGNIAYIFYGAALAAAVAGWQRNRWTLFYVVVLIASVFKAPLLSLLALPVLLGSGQWIPALATGGVGVGLFSMQSILWPELTASYLQAVKLQFDWNLDFGLSPAGMLGFFLMKSHIYYSPYTTLFYLAYAVPLGCALVWLARYYRNHPELKLQWVSVAIIGTLFLNPRIKEYDMAAITIPMLLVFWRSLRQVITTLRKQGKLKPEPAGKPAYIPDWPLAIAAAALFSAANLCAGLVDDAWKPLAMLLTVSSLAVGFWSITVARRECQVSIIAPREKQELEEVMAVSY